MKFYKVSLFLFCFVIYLPTVFAQESVNFRTYVEEKLQTYDRRTQVNGKWQTTKGIKLSEVCDVDENIVAERVFADYGAIFVAAFANPNIKFPNKCVFSETEAQDYQTKANPMSYTLGGVPITLQKPAMESLLAAVKEAGTKNLRISPRGSSESASRSYQDTIRLWNSRFLPALNYWVGKGKIKRDTAETVKQMQINDQVAQVLEWEKARLWFSKDLSKSILYSVAAPGASQHIFMLALDVEQFSNKQVRDILAKHGWFQTVQSDLPHFTYLGVEESSLPALGLKSVNVSGQKFWIPNLD